MTYTHGNDNRASEPDAWLPGPHLLDLGKQRAEQLFAAQNELLIAFENLNRDWANRAKSEAELASAATVKLMAARSIPDAADICREWMGKRMDLWAKDSHWLLSDSQKFVQAGARLLFDGTTGAAT